MWHGETGRVAVELAWVAVEEWNQKVRRRRREEEWRVLLELNLELFLEEGEFEVWKEEEFRRREEAWKKARAEEKKRGRRRRLGGWRSRRGGARR